jgi:hypothetical protein
MVALGRWRHASGTWGSRLSVLRQQMPKVALRGLERTISVNSLSGTGLRIPAAMPTYGY